jgi:hypothetical protein
VPLNKDKCTDPRIFKRHLQTSALAAVALKVSLLTTSRYAHAGALVTDGIVPGNLWD